MDRNSILNKDKVFLRWFVTSLPIIPTLESDFNFFKTDPLSVLSFRQSSYELTRKFS
ncbi:hypothetical protein LEP1GSC040_1607 [Leptospira santarosai str. 2000030832]|nr:hypothetical protein LEP1GSC040_1607 [Leptospira santarosai str. 2000030832]